jgi:hypothetical protein
MAAPNKFTIKFSGDTAELQSAVARANDTLTGFVEKVQGFGGAMVAGFAVSEIVAGMRQIIQAGGEAIENERKLLMALNGRVDVQQRLLDQAGRLADTTLFEDDEIIRQQQVLASMGLTEKQIARTIDAGVQLASVFDVELGQATEALAKSYFGVGKSLAAISPEFKGLTQEQMRNGEAIDLVLRKYQGFAEGLTEIGTGPMQQFEKQIGELQEELGKLVIPAVNPVLSKMTETIKSLTNEDIDPWARLAAVMLAIPTGGASLETLNQLAGRAKSSPTVADDPNEGLDFMGYRNQRAPKTPGKITAPKTGPKYNRFTGSLGAQDPFAAPVDMLGLPIDTWQQQIDSMVKSFGDLKIAALDTSSSASESMIRMAENSLSAGFMIGDALGNAIAGQQSFAQALGRITADIIGMFAQQAAAALAASVFKKVPYPFNIAAAAASVGIARALFANIGRSNRGPGGGMGASGGFREGGTRFEQLGQRIQLVGSVEVTGTQLNILLNNQARVNKRTLAG